MSRKPRRQRFKGLLMGLGAGLLLGVFTGASGDDAGYMLMMCGIIGLLFGPRY